MFGENIVGGGNNPKLEATLTFGQTFARKSESRLMKVCNTALERVIKPIRQNDAVRRALLSLKQQCVFAVEVEFACQQFNILDKNKNVVP